MEQFKLLCSGAWAGVSMQADSRKEAFAATDECAAAESEKGGGGGGKGAEIGP